MRTKATQKGSPWGWVRMGFFVCVGWCGWIVPSTFAENISCVMKPYMEVSLGPPVEGIIQTMHVDRGDWITKGQVLVTLEASVEAATVALMKAKAEAEAALNSTQAKMAFAKRKYARALDLSKSNAMAKHEVDEAETETILAEMAHLEAAEHKRIAILELHRATASLNLHSIRSPIAGVVVERLMSPGELARQTPILKLAQINPLLVEVFAPLSWFGKLKTGMKAAVRPEGSGQTTYSAKVTIVNPVVNSASGTFGVRLEMPNPSNVLPSGLACSVDFQLSSAENP